MISFLFILFSGRCVASANFSHQSIGVNPQALCRTLVALHGFLSRDGRIQTACLDTLWCKWASTKSGILVSVGLSEQDLVDDMDLMCITSALMGTHGGFLSQLELQQRSEYVQKAAARTAGDDIAADKEEAKDVVTIPSLSSFVETILMPVVHGASPVRFVVSQLECPDLRACQLFMYSECDPHPSGRWRLSHEFQRRGGAEDDEWSRISTPTIVSMLDAAAPVQRSNAEFTPRKPAVATHTVGKHCQCGVMRVDLGDWGEGAVLAVFGGDRARVGASRISSAVAKQIEELFAPSNARALSMSLRLQAPSTGVGETQDQPKVQPVAPTQPRQDTVGPRPSHNGKHPREGEETSRAVRAKSDISEVADGSVASSAPAPVQEAAEITPLPPASRPVSSTFQRRVVSSSASADSIGKHESTALAMATPPRGPNTHAVVGDACKTPEAAPMNVGSKMARSEDLSVAKGVGRAARVASAEHIAPLRLELAIESSPTPMEVDESTDAYPRTGTGVTPLSNTLRAVALESP